MQRYVIKLGDVLIIAAVIIVAALLFLPSFFRTEENLLVVRYASIKLSYPLDSDTEFDITNNGYTVHVSVSGGFAEVTESDCPDGVCRKSGKINRNGETVCCVPAGVVLRVTGSTEDVYYDAVAK